MSRTRSAAIILLAAAAGLFAIGTTIEKNRDHHDQPAATAETGGAHDGARETAEHREAEQRGAHTEGESEESKGLDTDRESTGLVVLAVLASLALAALVWRRPQRLVWIVVGLVAVTFAVFDLAEVAHQLDESATGLAAVAALVGAAHLAVAAIAARDAAMARS